MMKQILTEVRIILVEPAGPLNVGSIARVMKNMELERLVLVNPQCDYLGEEARRMAVHGVDVLEKAQVVADLPEALRGCHRAIATTARYRTLPTVLESPRIALPWLITDNLASALIFGREDRGLTNTELNYAQRFVRIPCNREYPSLNLAQSVSICAYELFLASRQKNYDPAKIPDPEKFPPRSPNPSTLDDLEDFYQHLETILLKMGYLYPQTALAKMEKFRRIFNRANLTKKEVALLRGMISQTEWALQFLPEKESE
jgi:tRNA/rRNA methyltransferase